MLRNSNRKKISPTEKWRKRWLRFYKFLACAAFCALATPYVEALSTTAAREYTAIFTWIATIPLFAIGYGIHSLLRLLLTKGGVEEEMSFSFETQWQLSSPVVLIPALVLSVIVAVIFAFKAGDILEPLLYPFYNKEVGFLLLLAACIAVTVLGCLLVTLQFHQICSLRTMLECLVALGLPYGLAIWWGNGVNGLFCLCVLVYALCLFILMNQEYVIKPSYMSKTCYATRELRMSGIKEAVKLWGMSIVGALLLLAFLSAFVTSFRILVFTERYEVLAFPFLGWPDVNQILYLIGLAMIPVAAVSLILRFVRPRLFRYVGGRCKEIWEMVKKAVFGFFRRLRFRKKIKKATADPRTAVDEAPKKQHYVDTVTVSGTSDKWVGLHQISYREFTANLKKMPDLNARYRYAYEVMIGELWRGQIGVETHQTPLEMSRVIARRTNIANIDALTDIYIGITYGENYLASASDVEAVCGILEARLGK